MDRLPESAKSIFLSALDIESTDERESFLAKACGDNGDLRREVEKLLDHQNQAGSFLESPAVAADLAPTVDRQASDYRGMQIGRYKIRELIGEGGMGVVYVAEQERPLRRKVALKVIKPGMDSKAVLGRFEAERNALALMNHPNIAKVLDAGTTEEGRPYFVMELVNGIPITQYCDDQKLSIRDRLGLFIDVCSAIQHAHQKGIIHRDIKPSNVLVTELDGKPIAKVIDFGVAKALNQSLTEHSVYTAFQTVIGTPLYMSPEQASFSAVDVDTRSDVYSLGVLLYELLTGSTPFTKDDFQQAAQDEVFRLIREREPQRPSNRISSLGETATRVSQLRRSQPDKLGQIIRGDLDWIVMKALAKERGRRYRTADSLSEDILRHLNDQPIEARPESSWYIASRFYRRNRALVTAASIILLLAAVMFGVIYQSLIKVNRLNQDLVNLLDENRKYIIERISLKAFEGKHTEVLSLVDRHRELLDAADNWDLLLEATTYLHQGDNTKAMELTKPIVERTPQNIPAAAILTRAYMHQGEWTGAMIAANKLRNAVPRDEYRDLDKLYMGYSLIHLDSEKARELLEDVLKDNKSWLICHAIFANFSIHAGFNSGDESLIEPAVERLLTTSRFADETPLLLHETLWGLTHAIQWRKKEAKPIDDLKRQAFAIAERLAKHQKYTIGVQSRAHFYDTIGESEKAIELWSQLLDSGSEMTRWAAIAGLMRYQSTEELLAQVETSHNLLNDAWSRIGLAYLLADTSDRGGDAINIFEEVISERPAIADRYVAIEILLLLGEREMAVQYAENWLSELSQGIQLPDTTSEYAEEQLLLLIARGEQPADEPDNRTKAIMVEHTLGLLAIANGDRESAITHFARSIEPPYITLDQYWGEAFLERLQEDEDWPRGNSKMKPGR